MANAPTQNKNYAPVDPYRLRPNEFHEVVMWMPHEVLHKHNIPRNSFLAICLAISRHCNFKTGEDIRVSQALLSEESGTTPATVKAVLSLLTKMGILEVTGHQRRPGRSSENYRFRNSELAKRILKKKDLGPRPPRKKGRATGAPQSDSPITLSDSRVTSNDSPITSSDSRVDDKEYKDYQDSDANAPSLSTSSLNPSGRDESSEQEDLREQYMRRMESRAHTKDALDELLAGDLHVESSSGYPEW